MENRSAPPGERLPVASKLVYALGDHTVNVALSAASLLYLFFLTSEAGVRPALAGLVMWVARAVDAITDPLMGRISDLTPWKVGRRRGYFLIGALPFGVFFSLMWVTFPEASQATKFAYYAAVYVGVSLAMTCLSVPYLALIPEMATDYDERTSLNTYRGAAAVIGTLVAVGMKALSDALGGDAASWRTAGIVMGVWVVLPWFAVYAVSFERPGFRRPAQVGFAEGARLLAGHRAYRLLCGFYIAGRTAVDLVGAMFLLYFTYWIGRESDFAPALGLFLVVVVLVLPIWLRISRSSDKHTVFNIGAAWWIASMLIIYAAGPEWPRWSLFVLAALAAIGYAVADLMPWAMLGEVVDEDEVRTGERREGVYVGFFMFLRKLGGATAVALVGFALELAGYRGDGSREEQSALALESIRVLTSLAPAAFLVVAIWVAMGYPLTRAAHQKVLAELERRSAAS